MFEDLLIPLLVSLFTVVVLGPFVAWTVRPYLDARNNRIQKTTEGYAELLALIKVVHGNLKVVHKEASRNTQDLLIPTYKLGLSAQLGMIESDVRRIVYLLTLLAIYNEKYRFNPSYSDDLARVMAGVLKIKLNIEENTHKTINGKNGLRKVNKAALEAYLKILESLLSDLENNRATKHNKFKNMLLQRTFV